MLPSILAKQLEEGISDYIETTFPMTNAPFQGSMTDLLQTKDSVYHDPYVAVRLPFRVSSSMPDFKSIHSSYLPYVHQMKAFDRLTGEDGRSTLIATGTGSGKTECFLYPILEYCYNHIGQRGIKALIIYPMNALATDQAKRIASLIYNSPELKDKVTAGMYVGGFANPNRMMGEENVITDRETLLQNPPDILMTNYKMLDYLLIRPQDASLWQDNRPDTLKYIAVDELHTFDGAQGTDLACLLRRLKSRLFTPNGYLCCVGTSATMGSDSSSEQIREYASEIFGEPFEADSVITEDRLSAKEFFDGCIPDEFRIPTNDEIHELESLTADDTADTYIRKAVDSWLVHFDSDPLSEEGRLELGNRLKHHSLVQALITYMGGRYCQNGKIFEDLRADYPAIRKWENPDAGLDSVFALISHARTKGMRPFLNVQVQLWLRELRRLVAKVDSNKVEYAVALDLNKEQSKKYLPVVNCRDCGATGWATLFGERHYAELPSLEAFYNKYFSTDTDEVKILYPHKHEDIPAKMIPARVCPECLRVELGEDSPEVCRNDGAEMIDVLIPSPMQTMGREGHKQYVCPFCGSRRGLSIVGLRSTTEISASISQMFASRFNDDKKTLAFSDNVQDAAHRAGFFNARTWRFGLRTAIQRFIRDGGAGLSLSTFQSNFIQYWHGKLNDEDFVSFFIAPNMTWMKSYEDMIVRRKLEDTPQSRSMIKGIERRLSYEVMLEYGIGGKVGRTLEKSGCSVLSFDAMDIEDIAGQVKERAENELGLAKSASAAEYQHMVAAVLNLMRQNGAFDDIIYHAFIASGGKDYLLSNSAKRHIHWLPNAQVGRNTPTFPVDAQDRIYNFDSIRGKKYTEAVRRCSSIVVADDSVWEQLSQCIFEEMVKNGIVTKITSEGSPVTAYGLNKDRVYISDQVRQMRCDTCGSVYPVSSEDAAFWSNAPCPRANCGGLLEETPEAALDYYGKLYTTGDMERINAREHTGLLERPDREKLEEDFKRKGQRIWDPNVLSCTPTLEMGIDIGDLSTVVLCSMPPSQSQFLQRAGRAGRKDGNSLTLAVANAKPHDLYFYADPMEMIAGEVVPPKIFLKASAVLERQFVAHCMDAWVRNGATEKDIPDSVGPILNRIDQHPRDLFPNNFLDYVKTTLSLQIRTFLQLFDRDELDDATREEIRLFAQGKGVTEASLETRILNAFDGLKAQEDALEAQIKDLTDLIKDLKAKPKDSSYDDRIKDFQSERTAYINVVQELKQKNVFNFMSDEGLIPNYAFPEAGIILRAVLTRRDDDVDEGLPAKVEEKLKAPKMIYEYNRSASSAISEFAPNNNFYVDGRKLTIDQVDLNTAHVEKWRLCPNCSHAELEAGIPSAVCPKCGSTGWADVGQLRTMLRVQMVYSNADYTKSMISDDSDDRSVRFYTKQMLVDVDEDHDIVAAYKISNPEYDFGYEYDRKATLREINFGENDTVGQKLTVDGREAVRKGFRICKYCGKIQPDEGKPVHTFSCKTQRPGFVDLDPYENCLFLYREFQTEILRILIPATSLESDTRVTESFVAAFMLGMKEKFGNVDHLRATVCDVPEGEGEVRKQYLVIYDSVPGGTGYLKQLSMEDSKDHTALLDILEKALRKMEECSCRNDSQKDGCYHCLFAYRQSRNIGNISRRVAMNTLKTILSGRDNIEKIDSLDRITIDRLTKSELEALFIEAIGRLNSAESNILVENGLVRGHKGYTIKIDGHLAWEIEPQVKLGPADGVAVPCIPDFGFWPVNLPDHKPVMVFTDGYRFHNNIVDDDTLKREAIRRGGKYRVWSLSWKDVLNEFKDQGDYWTQTLDPGSMPNYGVMYNPVVKNGNAEDLKPATLTPFRLFVRYLTMPGAESKFKVVARAYSLSALVPTPDRTEEDFQKWNDKINEINFLLHFTEDNYVRGGTFFGTWIPRTNNAHFMVDTGVTLKEIGDKKYETDAVVAAILNDRAEERTECYQQEWNGFWQFWNLLQFNPKFVGVSETGLEKQAYNRLPYVYEEADQEADPGKAAWSAIIADDLLDEGAIAFARKLADAGVPAPNPENVGLELADEQDEVYAMIELAWPDLKVGYLTGEQADNRDELEAQGWTILTDEREIDTRIWGGKQ